MRQNFLSTWLSSEFAIIGGICVSQTHLVLSKLDTLFILPLKQLICVLLKNNNDVLK
jgi:hypothetical protein